MCIELRINDGDDPAFVRCVKCLLARDVAAAQPERVYLARMDNWFGDRWYSFRGKYKGAAQPSQEHGPRRFIVPPFIPRRLLSEVCYERIDDSHYVPVEPGARLVIYQYGGEISRRYVDRFTGSGLLMWYSGNSTTRDMASAMVFVNTATVTGGWYLGVRRKASGWQFQKGIGITKRELEEYRTADTA